MKVNMMKMRKKRRLNDEGEYDEDLDNLKDDVKFGEVVSEPPTLRIIPKGATPRDPLNIISTKAKILLKEGS